MYKKIAATLVLIAPILSGCSAVMALHGKPTPNMDVVAVGNSRSQVESRLGTPSTSINLENGNTKSSYPYEVGGDSSPARAVGYVVMDFFTLFLGEIVTIPIEVTVGEKYVADIIYNENDQIVDMSLNKAR